MSLFPARRQVPDELDRLLAAALHAAVHGVQPPAQFGRAVCAAVAERPRPEPRPSALHSLLRGLAACLALNEDRRASPVMVHTIGFADLGSLSPGLAWCWALSPGGRGEPGGRVSPGRTYVTS